MRMFPVKVFITLATATIAIFSPSQHPLFTAEERAQVINYWGQPGRYTTSAPPEAAAKGPWQVRLTPEGSTWFWNYNRARGLGKTPPTSTPPAASDEQLTWEAWINSKVAFDRWEAGRIARASNEAALQLARGAEPLDIPPPEPGPIPEKLLSLVGNPPPFATAVAPIRHIVQFDSQIKITFVDNVPMRERYAYYRFPNGVMSGGTPVKAVSNEELDRLFAAAGISGSEQKVMKSVSKLEGGFDSVNTYDTGFVSVGLLQFACLKEGGGSLGSVLMRMKRNDPDGFNSDFRRFGIDVSPEGFLDVLDPKTGSEFLGPEAAARIIDDKRLIAVFQRAGRQSDSFRVAQLQVAKERYYPANDLISVQLGGLMVTCKVCDLVRTEAGMATLMDRKVNTGKIDPFAEIASRVAAEKGATSLEELAACEGQIVQALRYRNDYLADGNLSRPRDAAPLTNRGSGGSRNPRGKKPPKPANIQKHH